MEHECENDWHGPVEGASCIVFLYMPNSSFTLRAIANGRFAILEAARSVDEHHFVNFMLKKVRDPESNVRLPMLARQVAKEVKLNMKAEQAKKVIWEKVASDVVDSMQKCRVRLQL